MIGLPIMAVPIGDSAGVELHPIHLTNGDANHRPIGAKDLRDESAVSNNVTELENLNTENFRGACPTSASHDGLWVFDSCVRHLKVSHIELCRVNSAIAE